MGLSRIEELEIEVEVLYGHIEEMLYDLSGGDEDFEEYKQIICDEIGEKIARARG